MKYLITAVTSFLKKIIKLFIFLTICLFSPILYVSIKLIRPFKIVRIIQLMSNRYGHFVINPELYLLKKFEDKKNKNYFDIFYTSRLGVCNSEVLKLWRKKLIILPHYLLEPLDRLTKKIERNRNIHTINFFHSYIRDTHGYFKKYSPSILLDQEQKNQCIKTLSKHDIDFYKIKYACLFNRDDAYLNSGKKKKNWYYLSHHNYKINSFELAARKLSSNNIMLFRMGAKVEEPFNLNDTNVVDYANSSFRSELMDIFLASNCSFGISCGTGSSHFAILNRKPIIDLNANLHHLFTFLNNSILLSKHYFLNDENRNLNLKEILSYKEHELRRREQLDENGIQMIDCTPEEIVDAVDEMLLRLTGKWRDNNEIIDLQKKFKNHNWQDLYRIQGKKKDYYHGEIRGRYSSTFLLKNKDWLN